MADLDDKEIEEDEDLTLDDAQQESDSDEEDDAPSAEAASAKIESDKRVADLMSKWQKSDAENAKLKAQITKSNTKNSSEDSSTDTAQANEFMDFAREHARNTLYATDPRLAKYKIPVESVSGSTPDEMRRSLEAQVKVVAAMETQIRRDIMIEHGIDAEVVSGKGGSELNIAQLSEKEFAALIERRSRF